VPDKERAAFSVISESDNYEGAVVLGKKYSNLISQWRDDR